MLNTGGSPAVREYQDVNTRMEIETASPHRLIQMMMERALAKIAMARGAIDQGEIARKGELIGDTISIISGLQVSLNYKASKKLAQNFDALYDYMTRRLLDANVASDAGILLEVANLLHELKEAWDAIAEQIEYPDSANAEATAE